MFSLTVFMGWQALVLTLLLCASVVPSEASGQPHVGLGHARPAPGHHRRIYAARSTVPADHLDSISLPSSAGSSRPIAPLLASATAAEISAARKIVKDAIDKMRKLNKNRLDHPARNSYKLRPGTVVGKKRDGSDGDAPPPPPLLNITAEIARAAALVAESEAANATAVSTRANSAATRFWMEGIARKGTVPWGNDPKYKVCLLPSFSYQAERTLTHLLCQGFPQRRDRLQR